MEKNNVILTDDELKDVSGGYTYGDVLRCKSEKTEKECKNMYLCRWVDNSCVPKE